MKRELLATTILPAILLAVSANIALAQSVPDPTAEPAPEDQASGLEDIVVTAERRSESSQRVAVPMSVVGGQELARRGVVNIETLANAIPGLKLANANVATNISLRGLPSGGATQFSDPTIGFNYGGVALNRLYSTSGALYDLERVEVLKGPQGTLYGRNATVGALNLLPNRPTQILGGNVGFEVGNYDARKLSAAFNLPINDQLATRLAVSLNQHEGYLTNGYNDQNNMAARLGVLWDPTDDFSLYVWGDYYADDSRGNQAIYRYVIPGQEYQFPNNPWFGYEPAGCGNPAICPTWGNSGGPAFQPQFRGGSVDGADGFVDLTQHILAAEATWDRGFGTLTIIPAYVTSDLNTHTYGNGFEQRYATQADQTSLEVRLGGETDRLKWLVGAFYFQEDVDSATIISEPNGFSQIRTPNLTDESKAVFAQGTYSILERLRLTAGLRYTSESKSVDGTTIQSGTYTTTTCPSPGVIFPAGSTNNGYVYPIGYCIVPNSGDLTFEDTSGKLGLELDLAERSLLYANVSTGFKAGGFAPGLPPNTFRPEKLTAYTIGAKNRFFDNRLQLNLEAFYWSYEDQQISINRAINPAGQAAFPVNVPGYVQGIEVETVGRVTDNDTLSFTVLYATGKYDVYPTVVSSAGTIGGLVDFDRVALPEWQASVKAEHIQPLGRFGELSFIVDSHFETETNMRPIVQTSSRPGDIRPSYHIENASITYRPVDEAFSVSLFVDNIGDTPSLSTGTTGTVGPGVYFRPASNPLDARYATIGAPRTFGIRVKANF